MTDTIHLLNIFLSLEVLYTHCIWKVGIYTRIDVEGHF